MKNKHEINIQHSCKCMGNTPENIQKQPSCNCMMKYHRIYQKYYTE